MAATYDPTLTTGKDLFRFAMGDRGPTFLAEDEEYEALLDGADEPTTQMKLTMARVLSLAASNYLSVLVQGPVRKEWQNTKARYDELIKELKAELASEGDGTNSYNRPTGTVLELDQRKLKQAIGLEDGWCDGSLY